MKRQRAEISSNVISHIKSAHPIEMWRSNKLGIKEKINRGNFPRLIFSCPVPSGLPHRSHCVPMNMNPCDHRVFFCQAASIRIFFFNRFGQYHSQERVTVQSFKKFLAKKRINALACSKILSNTST